MGLAFLITLREGLDGNPSLVEVASYALHQLPRCGISTPPAASGTGHGPEASTELGERLHS